MVCRPGSFDLLEIGSPDAREASGLFYGLDDGACDCDSVAESQKKWMGFIGNLSGLLPSVLPVHPSATRPLFEIERFLSCAFSPAFHALSACGRGE